MRLNKTFNDITIEIFKNIFSPEQIEEMIAVDLSENDNILSLPIDRYFEKQFKISDTINVNGNESAEVDQNEIVLASYTTMYNNSPGIITFYKDNIKLYINSLYNCLNCSTPIGLNTALYIHYFVMSDLLIHENLHFFYDFKRQLTDTQFDIDIEEKLAVAHSFNTFSLPYFKKGFNINYYSLYEKFIRLFGNHKLHYKISNQNRILFDFLMKEHFMSYQSADYNNWQLFTQKNSYQTHFYNYIKNSKLDELLACGVPVNNISEEIDFIGINGTVIMVV